MRSAFALVVAVALVARPVSALVWPDVPARLEKDLASSDPAARVAAAGRLDTLGARRAAPLILAALADADVDVRVAAADAAVRARVAGATAAVIPWLGEHDARLRVAACRLARAMPDKNAVQPLARALSDPDGVVRTSAIEALGAQGSPDAVAPLLGKLDDPIPSVRAEVARALARLHDPRAVVPLMGKIEDSVPEVREAVARALGDLGDPRAAGALMLALRDASPDVRVVALTSLGRMTGAEVAPALVASVTDRNAAVRHAALRALGGLARGGSAEAIRVLVSRLGADDDATGDLDPTPVRDALVFAGERRADVVAALRIALRTASSPAAASSAAWVLGALHATAASSDIVAAYRRGTLAPTSALHALARAGTPADLPVVLERVGSDSPSIRAEALAATRSLLDPSAPDGRAVEPLLAVAEEEKLPPSDLARVLELLGRTRAARAAKPLEGFVSNGHPEVKLAAVDALGALGPTGADAALVPLVTSEVAEVRLHAADALANAGGAVSRDALRALLRGGGEVDRVAALTALAGILPRAPSDAAITELVGSLDVVAGGERDAVLTALAEAAPIPVLDRLLGKVDADDRRALVSGLAARSAAAPLVEGSLADADAGVRAEAAWALGALGQVPSLAALKAMASSSDIAARGAAVNASAAIARIIARLHPPDAVTMLCAMTHHPEAEVRANAMTGLALGGLRCSAGEDSALLVDPSVRVRAAAARAIERAPAPGDTPALARCASADPSPEVARLCAHPSTSPPAGPPRPTLVYVEAPDAERTNAGPAPRAGYLVEEGDGLLRAGTADRRGAFFDPVTPPGPLRLVPYEAR